MRSHFSQDRSHFSQDHSRFQQGDGVVERHWHQPGRPGFDNRPGFDGRPGFDNRPGFDGRPDYGNRPGYDNHPGYGNRPGYDGRPGYDNRPGYDTPPVYNGQWGYDGQPGFGWHRPERIDPDEQLRRQYERLYDIERRQFDRARQETIYGAAPNRFYRPDPWQPSPYPAPGNYRPPSTGYPLPPHGYPLPGQSRPPAFNEAGRGVELYSDPRGPAPATPYSR